MGYRQVPLSQRLGLSFGEDAYWQVFMPDAECFMYFIAQLQRLFGPGHTLYVESRQPDPEVQALYQQQAQPKPQKVTPFSRNTSTARFHVQMGPALSKRLNALAACKTYAQVGEAMLVYDDAGKVWMDGRRLGERVIKLSGDIPEAQIRQFASGPLRGELSWMED